jgi:hypothetical protein
MIIQNLNTNAIQQVIINNYSAILFRRDPLLGTDLFIKPQSKRDITISDAPLLRF